MAVLRTRLRPRYPKPGGLPKNLAQHARAGSQGTNKSLTPGRAARKSGRVNLGSPSLGLNMDIRAALKNGIAQLREANAPSFTLAAELLLLHVLGRNRTWLYAHPEETLSDTETQRFLDLIARRAAGEPTQHLTAKQEFWGLQFEVTPDVLIPRPETEHVIEVALDRLTLRELRANRPPKSDGAGLQIADIGTGSGCIAITLAKELPAANFLATDISPAALAVAKRNAQRHGVSDRINFREANLFARVGAQQAAPQLGTLPNSAPPSALHQSRIT